MPAAAFALLAALALAAPAPDDAPNGPQDTQLSGTVGAIRIGMDVVVEGGHVASGHYFYVSQLKDIPLKEAKGPDPLTLTGADGSRFHLHFIGNGSEHGAPLTFDTSVGLVGSWTQGSRTLPVKLSLDGASGSGQAGHRYALITQAPDAVVEAHARQFLDGALAGDRRRTAEAVAFPLHVNGSGRRRLVIRTPAELAARWDAIFTPAFLARLRTAVPHDMFVRDEGAMVANGAVWFSDRGASELNLDVPG